LTSSASGSCCAPNRDRAAQRARWRSSPPLKHGLLEAVGLPSSVESIVVLDTMAWLEPLADMISFGNRGVVIL
jgi:hypothetical protein